jgi:Ca2+-binding EF-hand superfamily protein
MKISLTTCALAVLLAGPALAADSPADDGAHGLMRADANGDGKVSKEELAAAHDKKAGEWFAKTDTNHDGYLTPDEIQQSRETRQQRRGDGRAHREERFKETDANNDGQLSLDEVQAKMPRLAERFSTLDADKNGMLSKEELREGAPWGRPQPQN